MDKISVVIPVYNVENELERCLESVLNQTFKNLEIILINDGSSDNSLEICKNYEVKYNNIKVFTQSNQGQSSARNRGIEQATGKYIGFVDSDDVIHLEMFEQLFEMLQKNDADVSAVQIQTVDDITEIKENRENSKTNTKIEIVEKADLLIDYMYDGLNKKAGQYSAGRKLFKRELLDEVRFLEGKINEDILFNYEVLENANRLVKTERVMYFYLQDSNSTMRRTLSEKELDLLYICDVLIDKAKKKNNTELIKLAKMKKARSYFSLLAKIAYFGTNIPKRELSEIKSDLVSGLRDNYMLLMKSPIPINRKIIISAFALNFNISERILKTLKK